MGFEYWEVGFGKKLGWEMGLVPPLQDPLELLSTEARLMRTLRELCRNAVLLRKAHTLLTEHFLLLLTVLVKQENKLHF